MEQPLAWPLSRRHGPPGSHDPLGTTPKHSAVRPRHRPRRGVSLPSPRGAWRCVTHQILDHCPREPGRRRSGRPRPHTPAPAHGGRDGVQGACSPVPGRRPSPGGAGPEGSAGPSGLGHHCWRRGVPTGAQEQQVDARRECPARGAFACLRSGSSPRPGVRATGRPGRWQPVACHERGAAGWAPGASVTARTGRRRPHCQEPRRSLCARTQGPPSGPAPAARAESACAQTGRETRRAEREALVQGPQRRRGQRQPERQSGRTASRPGLLPGGAQPGPVAEEPPGGPLLGVTLARGRPARLCEGTWRASGTAGPLVTSALPGMRPPRRRGQLGAGVAAGARVRPSMERFSLLSISGPRMSSSAPSAFPDIVSSRATSLPGKLWCHQGHENVVFKAFENGVTGPRFSEKVELHTGENSFSKRRVRGERSQGWSASGQGGRGTLLSKCFLWDPRGMWSRRPGCVGRPPASPWPDPGDPDVPAWPQ